MGAAAEAEAGSAGEHPAQGMVSLSPVGRMYQQYVRKYMEQVNKQARASN
jgi:hypothetical protein